MTRIWVAAILLAIAGGTHRTATAGSISLKAGVGYDFLSQEYFLDSLTQAGVDSFLTGWSLKTDYLDDFRAMTELHLTPRTAGGLELRSVYEQGTERLRFKLYPTWRPKFGDYTLESRAEFDWRKQYRGEEEPGDSYLSGTGQCKLKRRFGESFSVWAQGRGEFVRFEDPSAYAYNYRRFGGRIGADLFSGLSLGSIDLFYMSRQVSDSSTLDYGNFGLEASLFSLAGWGNLDLLLRLERKDYNRDDQTDDYSRLEFGGRSEIELGKSWFAKPDIELDGVWYNGEDLFNSNYTKVTTSAVAGRNLFGPEVAVGPEVEWLVMPRDTSGEAYLESGVKGTCDFIRSGQLFSTLDYHFGYRQLDLPDDLQSSFRYQRVNLIADWSVLGGLNLNLLLGVEWEWHTRSEDNNRLVLLSSGLTYTF